MCDIITITLGTHTLYNVWCLWYGYLRVNNIEFMTLSNLSLYFTGHNTLKHISTTYFYLPFQLGSTPLNWCSLHLPLTLCHTGISESPLRLLLCIQGPPLVNSGHNNYFIGFNDLPPEAVELIAVLVKVTKTRTKIHRTKAASISVLVLTFLKFGCCFYNYRAETASSILKSWIKTRISILASGLC